MAPKVLFIGTLNKVLPEYKEFLKKFECIHYETTTAEKLIEDFKTKYHDIEAIYGAWLGVHLLGGFRGKILDNAPSSLKVISICSVGYDGYDGEKMAEKNIILTNVPALGAAEPVAELTLFNALQSFRNFRLFELNFASTKETLACRRGLEEAQFDSTVGKVSLRSLDGYSFGNYSVNRGNISPKGHNAVVVGFGKIGYAIAEKLDSIGMNIHYVKRSPLSPQEVKEIPFKVTYHKTLLDTKEIADLVVLACPGTPETRHMVNKELIDAFKNPFRIINVGRGSIVDENALVEGLRSGKILFAGLDVFEDEPKVHPALFDRQDVFLTPHIGASTVENFDFTAIYALKNIENVILEKGNGLSRVN